MEVSMNKDVDQFQAQTNTKPSVDKHTETFDGFINKNHWKSYGFKYEGVKEVVWIPKVMVKDGRINVDRLDNDQGFNVTMPVWLAEKIGLV